MLSSQKEDDDDGKLTVDNGKGKSTITLRPPTRSFLLANQQTLIHRDCPLSGYETSYPAHDNNRKFQKDHPSLRQSARNCLIVYNRAITWSMRMGVNSKKFTYPHRTLSTEGESYGAWVASSGGRYMKILFSMEQA